MSAPFPGSPPPAGLTDGVIEGAPYGTSTQLGDAPWVEVDLGRVYHLDKIKIYNRGDGFGDDGLPMTLQVSENGVAYLEVETRSTTFEQTSPCKVAKGRGRAARYVRVRGARGKYVALSELEKCYAAIHRAPEDPPPRALPPASAGGRRPADRG